MRRNGRAPAHLEAGDQQGGTPLLEVEGLAVTYRARQGQRRGRRSVIALDGVDLHIAAGESLGVVGESGSGKSTLARTLVGLVRPSAGRICFAGRDVTAVKGSALRQLRRDIQMVFQDPYGSVNPRFKVRDVVAEPLENYHRDWSRAQRTEHVDDLLARVRFPADAAYRSVSELSGGQLQRVGIARALALGPRLLIADEPVSALDVSVQARVLNLLADLKASEGISFLFITHNLAVAQYIADRIAVVYGGRVVETGQADEVIEDPKHPYTKELLAAVPGLRRDAPPVVGDPAASTIPVGEVGCPYRSRCALATDVCEAETPLLVPREGGRLVACHHVPAEEPVGEPPTRAAGTPR